MAITSVREIFILSILCAIDFRSCVMSRSFLHENKTDQGGIKVNVLATVLPPFTYFDASRGIENGVDFLILKTIAARLHFEMNFTGTLDSGRIPIDSLE